MKRWLCLSLVTVAMISLLAMPAFAVGNEAVYVLSKRENTISMSKEEGELTFWEAPDVITGQSRANGVITLKNDTDYTVDFALNSVLLPYDNEAALIYLDAVTITLTDGDKVMYHGSMTRLMDPDRAEIGFKDVAPWESRQIGVSISCAFTYEGELPSYSSLLWEFHPTIHDKAPQTTVAPMPSERVVINWSLITKIAGVILVLAAAAGVYIRIVRRRSE